MTSGYSSVFVHRLAQGHSASTPIRSVALYHLVFHGSLRHRGFGWRIGFPWQFAGPVVKRFAADETTLCRGLRFFRFFILSFLRTDRLVPWSSARHYPSVGPYELSDSVVFGRIFFVFFVRRDFRLLPILSPRDVYRSAAAEEVGRSDEATGL